MASFARNKKLHHDLTDLLSAAGVGRYLQPMAIQFMNMLPRTTEPYAAGAVELAKGLQRLLNQQGAKLTVDGGMGTETVRALMKFSGPRWYDKSWAQLYDDVLEGKPWDGWQRESRASANAGQPIAVGSNMLDDLIGNPVVLLAAGAFVWWKFFRKDPNKRPARELEDL